MQSAPLPPMKSGANGDDLDDTAERDAVCAPVGVGEGERSGSMKGTCPGEDGHVLLYESLCYS